MLALLPPASSIRALAFHRRLPVPLLLPPPRTLPRLGPAPARSFMAFSAEPAPGEEKAESEEEPFPATAAAGGGAGDAGEVSHEEWRRWGTSSPLPGAVAAVVRELLEMEAAAGEKMRFGGVGSKLKGDFKDVEDKKHRAVYETLADSDQKLQYFSARQIGCRLLGSRGYLCQKCWLPAEDCMCANVFPCNLWRGMKFWLYMHPKDFLRQNNTGKLLWQVFGIQAAQLCLFGIQEHEDIMWDAFQRSGKGKISFLYLNKSTIPKSVKDLKFDGWSLSSDLHDMSSQDEPFNFVVLDGTWSNSAALYRRLKPYTYEQDVFAINGLYTALGAPQLPNWTTNGGDPCDEGWQGVSCVASNITSIILSGASLGGQLGNTLGNFTSLITLDLSNNNIGGTIPDGLPVTMQKFFLSANQLSGSLPSTLSSLTLLTSMSLNNNQLSGDIPDVFLALTGLANLDFSSNNLTGPLPPSMGNLTALTSLHIQNNQLTGTLDVLQDLPFQDLNIENNLFSGPVPVKLLNLPNFKKDGNPFNTSIAPSAQPPAAPTPLPSVSPPARHVPTKEPSTSSSVPGGSTPGSGKHTVSTIKLVGYILTGVVSAVVIVLMVMYCLSKCKEKKSRDDIYTKNKIGRVPQKLGEPKIKEVAEIKESPVKHENNVGKGSHVISDAKEEHRLKMPTSAASNVVYDARDGQKSDSSMAAAPGVVTVKPKEHVIDMKKADNLVEEQLHPMQPVALRTEKVIVNPSVRTRKGRVPSVGKVDLTSTVKSFSIASLQQYTNSFSEENFIRDSRFGKVYLAELPDGELLEVLAIDAFNSKVPVDAFLELVVSISELRHPNILGLVGYCAEFEQRLLVYEHCSKMTLHDELHYLDDSSKPLSWNARLQVAVGAAKALQHLHDGCQPPIVHQNFEPSVVLLNSTLVVHISESGLASLASKSVSQLSGRTLFHYEAPEVHESGSVSDRSDVYSFGVVMLELLTGRKPYDSSRPRAEQHLVRWATSQLYDIDAIAKMVDPSIQGQCSEKALSRFADIISRCIQHEPEFRPPMSEVVQDLTRMVSNASKASM